MEKIGGNELQNYSVCLNLSGEKTVYPTLDFIASVLVLIKLEQKVSEERS